MDWQVALVENSAQLLCLNYANHQATSHYTTYIWRVQNLKQSKFQPERTCAQKSPKHATSSSDTNPWSVHYGRL
uniref:Uncharacterized protein n=1 Tax=Arundo donax TaxID=35708 RepID=A0A0A9DL43_ARUDO